jgi:hypothetical protein
MSMVAYILTNFKTDEGISRKYKNENIVVNKRYLQLLREQGFMIPSRYLPRDMYTMNSLLVSVPTG